MPKVNLTIEQDPSDFREQQASFQLSLENQGGTAIELMTISPRIPERSSLLETKDFSALALKAGHTKLCEELSTLTQDALRVTDEGLRKRLVEIHREELAAIISGQGVFEIYLSFFKGTWSKAYADRKLKEGALFPRIETAADAKRVYDEILAKLPALDESIRRAYAFKVGKLVDLEKPLGSPGDVEGAPIARIEGGSVFNGTYIVQFPRNWLNTSQYSFAVEVSYRETGQKERHNSLATAAIRISPKPMVLSLIAVGASFLGVLLKHALKLAETEGVETSGLAQLWGALASSEAIAAAILAFIFFNAFEYTELLKEFRKNLGWRTALLLGVLCGLGSQRIVNAIGALVGM